MEGNLNIRFRGVCNIYILIHGKAWLQKVLSKSGSPLFTRKEYYIFIEWSCSINKISTPSKIFRNDEVTVRKAENLFIIIHCIISVYLLFTMLDNIKMREEKRETNNIRRIKYRIFETFYYLDWDYAITHNHITRWGQGFMNFLELGWASVFGSFGTRGLGLGLDNNQLPPCSLGRYLICVNSNQSCFEFETFCFMWSREIPAPTLLTVH